MLNALSSTGPFSRVGSVTFFGSPATGRPLVLTGSAPLVDIPGAPMASNTPGINAVYLTNLTMPVLAPSSSGPWFKVMNGSQVNAPTNGAYVLHENIPSANPNG